MPFANREMAVIVANELNRHNRGIWFYTVERQIEGKRWIIVGDGEMIALRAQGKPRRAIAEAVAAKGHEQARRQTRAAKLMDACRLTPNRIEPQRRSWRRLVG